MDTCGPHLARLDQQRRMVVPAACRQWLGSEELVLSFAPAGSGLALWHPAVHQRFLETVLPERGLALNAEEERVERRVLSMCEPLRLQAGSGRLRLAEVFVQWLRLPAGGTLYLVPNTRWGYVEILTEDGFKETLMYGYDPPFTLLPHHRGEALR